MGTGRQDAAFLHLVELANFNYVANSRVWAPRWKDTPRLDKMLCPAWVSQVKFWGLWPWSRDAQLMFPALTIYKTLYKSIYETVLLHDYMRSSNNFPVAADSSKNESHELIFKSIPYLPKKTLELKLQKAEHLFTLKCRSQRSNLMGRFLLISKLHLGLQGSLSSSTSNILITVTSKESWSWLSIFLEEKTKAYRNYKINLLGAVLSFWYYHWFESDSKRHLHFPITDMFHSLEKEKVGLT